MRPSHLGGGSPGGRYRAISDTIRVLWSHTANLWAHRRRRRQAGRLRPALSPAETRMTTERTVLGTVAYMTPEQALGRETGPPADLYALGCVLYECVTGAPPFPGDEAVAVITRHLSATPVAPTVVPPPEQPDAGISLRRPAQGRRVVARDVVAVRRPRTARRHEVRRARRRRSGRIHRHSKRSRGRRHVPRSIHHRRFPPSASAAGPTCHRPKADSTPDARRCALPATHSDCVVCGRSQRCPFYGPAAGIDHVAGPLIRTHSASP